MKKASKKRSTTLLITANSDDQPKNPPKVTSRGVSVESMSRRSSAVTLPLAAELLRDQLSEFLSTLGPVLAEAATAAECGEWQVEETTITVEISAQGKVSLFGAVGLDTGARGGLVFKFRRVKA